MNDIEDVFSLSDQLMILKDGKAISEGNPFEVYEIISYGYEIFTDTDLNIFAYKVY